MLSDQTLWNQIKKNLQVGSENQKLLQSVLNSVTLETSILKKKTHLILTVPSSYHQKIIKRYLSNIQNQIKNQGVFFNTLNIKTVFTKKPDGIKIKKDFIPVSSVSPPIASSFSSVIKPPTSFLSKWTFSSFIQGPNNCFAFSLAKNIAANPFQSNTNPLFIYGPSGVGKTHLLHAIGNELKKQKPQLKVRYLSAERFFNDCINHIRKGEMSNFRQKYRTNTDVLLLDDIQILGKGESIQGEFFYTFEALKQSNCQIVLASDQKPKNIKGLKDRIKSRFEGGVVVDIQLPDKDIKIAILKHKSQYLNLNISEEIILYLSEIPTKSVRELEGFLNKIKMFCELQKTKITLSLVKQLFFEDSLPLAPLNYKTLNSSTSTNGLKIKILQKEVCSQYYIKLEELKSKSRIKHLVQARGLIMFVARNHLNCSLTEIGSYFGNRNHSTVLNGINNISKQQQNPCLSKKINLLKKLINK